MPLVQLLPPAVEDVGIELHDALVVALGAIHVVDAVAVGREGVRHLELALRDLYRYRLCILPVVLGVCYGVGAVDECSIEHDAVRASLGEGVLRLLLVAHEVGLRCTLFGEAPLVVGRVRTYVLRVGVEHHRERSRPRIARARLFAFVGCECGLWVDGRHFVGVSL